jgi:phage virion morphogenesis protein
MTEPFRIEVDDREVMAALAGLQGAADDLTPLMAEIEGILVDATERAFENQEDPATGAPWAELSPVTKSRRADPDGPILKDSGSLVSSVNGAHDADSAEAGVSEIYGITHQLGAKKGQYGSASGAFQFDGEGLSPMQIPIPWGDIPARPFLGIGDEDKEEISDAVSRYIQREI